MQSALKYYSRASVKVVLDRLPDGFFRLEISDPVNDNTLVSLFLSPAETTELILRGGSVQTMADVVLTKMDQLNKKVVSVEIDSRHLAGTDITYANLEAIAIRLVATYGFDEYALFYRDSQWVAVLHGFCVEGSREDQELTEAATRIALSDDLTEELKAGQ